MLAAGDFRRRHESRCVAVSIASHWMFRWMSPDWNPTMPDAGGKRSRHQSQVASQLDHGHRRIAPQSRVRILGSARTCEAVAREVVRESSCFSSVRKPLPCGVIRWRTSSLLWYLNKLNAANVFISEIHNGNGPKIAAHRIQPVQWRRCLRSCFVGAVRDSRNSPIESEK